MISRKLCRNEEDEPPPEVAAKIDYSLQYDRPVWSCSPSYLTDIYRSSWYSSKKPSTFKVSPECKLFKKKYFPQVTNTEWNDWKWQIENRIKDRTSLEKIISLSEDEHTALGRKGFNVNITPYYLSLLDRYDHTHPVRRSVIPVCNEFIHSRGEENDPLGEDNNSPVSCLVHRYPDRVLFLVTDFCSTHCRYCTRSRMVANSGKGNFNLKKWEEAIDYIRNTPAIRDVLISGGDPLTLSDEKIEWLLSKIKSIPHVEFVRIGSKVPTVLPQRINNSLIKILKRYKPVWLSIHFTHPDELTPETSQACNRLADAGVPLGSQTVLLAGINDNVETMKTLMHGLLKIRVRPYYIYQCDPVAGSLHFRTPVEKGLEIIRGLRGYTSGYAVPTFVIDAPGGGGKIPLLPEYMIGRDGEDILLRNYKGNIYRYPDTGGIIY